ncbi:N-acetylmuramoyl-L-alanine amidase, partial [Actinomadura flavalba]|uniref:N-acetylmuramoyl-L-alanine amidase n=1 Tax=Actinomadura flavalba TaxID=1120938 RepID=UPI00036DF5F1
MDIVSRSQWGAAPPRSRVTTTWSARRYFVVHHSEGPITQTVKSIQSFHMRSTRSGGRGWSDIGYNFLVDHTGRIYEGRGWTVVGAHATGYNTTGIGVCVIGRDGTDITAAARRAVRWLYDEAARRAGRPLAARGHGQLVPSDCPGDTLRAWIRDGMPATGAAPAPSSWMEKAVKNLPQLKRGSTGEAVHTLRGLLHARSHQEIGPVEGGFDAKVEAA